jgi:uncharacterized protein
MPYNDFDEQRIYAADLVRCEIKEKESALEIFTDNDLCEKALSLLFSCRSSIERYIGQYPEFAKALQPCKAGLKAPKIIKEMARAAREFNVGPMAAVAGAIAQYIGKELIKNSQNVIIKNGSDFYIKTVIPRKLTVWAGDSRLSNKLAVVINPKTTPLGISAVSGVRPNSLSFGAADAVVVLAESALISDAAATAIGNIVKTENDIEKGLEMAEKIKHLHGLLIIKNDRLGLRGKIEIAGI